MWATSFFIALISIFNIKSSCSENVQTTKVFIIEIHPKMFNWTTHGGDDFEYQASLVNAPDLPKWVEYRYSKRHHAGFLYGVPPKNQGDIEIEVIARNEGYETRRRVIHLNIENKVNPARYQVHLKINNLNVEDFFDQHKRSRLLDIFKSKLWKESFGDLYETFLTSAVSLGARLPLSPNDGEGVVIRLGSETEFSNTLLELQEEVKPLYKLQPCPRDYKRTSVERLFREQEFILDWCDFKLINDSWLTTEKSTERVVNKPDIPVLLDESIWTRPAKEEVPKRSYAAELAFITILPALVMLTIVILLTFVLGYQRIGMRDESDEFFDNVFRICEDYARDKDDDETDAQILQYTAVLRATAALREMTMESDSATSSPYAAIRSGETNSLSRPTPPPYTGTMKTAVVDF